LLPTPVTRYSKAVLALIIALAAVGAYTALKRHREASVTYYVSLFYLRYTQ